MFGRNLFSPPSKLNFERGEEHFGKEEHQRETKNAQEGFRCLNGRIVKAALSQRLSEHQKSSMAGRGRRTLWEAKQRAVKEHLWSGTVQVATLETKNALHSRY